MLCPIGQGKFDKNLDNLYKKLTQEISQLNPRLTIISTENLSYATSDFTKDFKMALKNYEIKIVFYIREQTLLLESTYLWWQKANWNYEGSIIDFYKKHKASFNFLNRIEPWISEFGAEKVECHLYNKDIIGHDVVSHFLNSQKIESLTNKNLIRENPSLPACFSNIISQIDNLNPNKEIRESIVNALIEAGKEIPTSRRGSLIDVSMQEEIKHYYYDSNQKFAKFLSEPARSIFISSVTPNMPPTASISN